MLRKLHPWLLALLVIAMASCSKDDNITTVKGKYDNGFFILNEGSYFNAPGSVHFYSYDSDSLIQYAYANENPGKEFGTNTQVLEYGTIYNKRFYFVVNLGGPVVTADASTLKEISRTPDITDSAHAFLGVDDTRALVSTIHGLYKFNLTNSTLGEKVAGISDNIGDMIKAGNYIFVLSADRGILALKASDFSFVKALGSATIGFAMSKDGSLWAATTNSLLKIDYTALTIAETLPLPFDIYYNQYTFNSACLIPSTTENALYLAGGYTDIYKYTIGSPASLTKPFVTLPAGQYLFGKGLGFNAAKNQLVATTTDNIYGGTNNTVYNYAAASGASAGSFTFKGSFFPAMTVFH